MQKVSSCFNFEFTISKSGRTLAILSPRARLSLFAKCRYCFILVKAFLLMALPTIPTLLSSDLDQNKRSLGSLLYSDSSLIAKKVFRSSKA